MEWLDSLSEDWVSQPRSNPPSSSVPASPNHTVDGSRSKLPRQTSSGQASTGKHGSRPPSSASTSAQKAVLRTQTPSQVNSSMRKNAVNNSVKAGSPRVSGPANMNGTVQQKANGLTHGSGQVTPEWKRRLVNGKTSTNESTDLLSSKPMKLEGMFRPPTLKTKQVPHSIAKRPSSKEGKGSPPILRHEQRELGEWLDPSTKVEGKEQGPSTKNGAHLPRGEDVPDDAPCNSHEPSLLTWDQSSTDNFSPAIVSKQLTANGKLNFVATPSPRKRSNEAPGGHIAESHRIIAGNGSREAQGQRSSPFPGSPALDNDDFDITSQSLPADLSAGTDLIANDIAGSKPILTSRELEDALHQSESIPPSSESDGAIAAERSDFVIRHAAEDAFEQPQTPEHQKPTAQSSPERARSSLSPLKLFDKYDTYTNDRVFRRLSKFEETLAQTKSDTPVSNEGRSSPSSPSPQKIVARRRPSEDTRSPNSSRISSFGEGQFEDYVFPNDITQEPSLPRLPRIAAAETNRNAFARDRAERRSRPASQRHRQQEPRQLSTQKNEFRSTSCADRPTKNGKRPPQSPNKEAARKRRRTLQSPQDGNWSRDQPNAEESHMFSTPSRNIVGRKRKDARYENVQQPVDPEVLAMRQIRRPRNPTPNHASSSTRHSPVRIAHRLPDVSFQADDSELDRQYDAPTRILAVALADQSIHAAEKLISGSRHSSLNTGDYLNDAERIMNFIRAENRPRSSDEALKRSHFGEPTIYEESTVDKISRPPSREGAHTAPDRQNFSTDTRAFSQLRKFADGDDLGFALNSTLKSLRLSRSNETSENQLVDQALIVDTQEESDPPNVHIKEQFSGTQEQGARPSGHDRGHSRNGSQASNDSDVRSIPTRSSAASSNKMTIAPQNVAHLLSDCMAGMVFDRDKQKWVRHNQGLPGSKAQENNVSDMSDDDFFNDIPDLSVNEMEELRRVRHFVSTADSVNPFATTAGACQHEVNMPREDLRAESNNDIEDRPQTADGKSMPPVEDSSAPSKYSRLASSGPVPSTRATSWGDEQWLPKPQATQAPTLPAVDEVVDQSKLDEVEREISIMEGRVADVPFRDRKSRVLTVTFSSPPVGQMHSPDIRDALDHDQSDLYDESPSQQNSILAANAERRRSRSLSRRPKARLSSRRMSLDDMHRPMSRVDEHEEMSLVHYSGKGNRTLDLAISTPLPLMRSLMGPSDSRSQSVSAYRLSPLSDFTVHQSDRPLDAIESARTRAPPYQESASCKNQISLTAQSLIKHLTDLEPYEPYWEYIRTIDLCDRSLTSLHMLDELCNHAEQLNVSKNGISELNGIPSTIRFLNVRNNCLSDLSAWHHLHNLQYLDLSHNQLTTFRGLWSLVHLRSLNADYNSLETLAGLEGLDGLQSLRVRGNRLRQLDFEEFDLTRLLDLDLSHNGLAEMKNLQSMPGLRSLNISHNELTAWNTSFSFPKLEDLDLSVNHLETFDISALPGLKRLDLGNNSITSVQGVQSATNLSYLSLRSQQSPDAICLDELHEVEHLYLSSNMIPKFAPSSPFLNLRTLELASCGLHTLSHDFGQQCPNIRCLNLNYNALRDVSALSGIVRLERLQLASNRISRLRQTISALASLSRSLAHLDLRDNPLTLGFYLPSPIEKVDNRLVTYPSPADDQAGSSTENEKWSLQYQLPLLDSSDDAAARQRLDDATKARRRVYELMVMENCPRLEWLDGLAADRESVQEPDGAWHRLNELGVL